VRAGSRTSTRDGTARVVAGRILGAAARHRRGVP
jgi:hypothetical protein